MPPFSTNRTVNSRIDYAVSRRLGDGRVRWIGKLEIGVAKVERHFGILQTFESLQLAKQMLTFITTAG